MTQRHKLALVARIACSSYGDEVQLYRLCPLCKTTTLHLKRLISQNIINVHEYKQVYEKLQRQAIFLNCALQRLSKVVENKTFSLHHFQKVKVILRSFTCSTKRRQVKKMWCCELPLKSLIYYNHFPVLTAHSLSVGLGETLPFPRSVGTWKGEHMAQAD